MASQAGGPDDAGFRRHRASRTLARSLRTMASMKNLRSWMGLCLFWGAAGCGGAELADSAGEPVDDSSLEISAACPRKPLLKSGLHPDASDRLRCIGVSASQISQTIGSAPASAGYHAKDGTANGQPYTAAVDIRTVGRSESQIRTLLSDLGKQGFAAWYRKPGFDGWPSSEAPHIHAVYAGCAMKPELDGQVKDYRAGLNGLASHTRYTFWVAPQAMRDDVYNLWNKHN